MKEIAKKLGYPIVQKSGNNRFRLQQLTSFAWNRAEYNIYYKISICELFPMHVTYMKEKKKEMKKFIKNMKDIRSATCQILK